MLVHPCLRDGHGYIRRAGCQVLLSHREGIGDRIQIHAAAGNNITKPPCRGFSRQAGYGAADKARPGKMRQSSMHGSRDIADGECGIEGIGHELCVRDRSGNRIITRNKPIPPECHQNTGRVMLVNLDPVGQDGHVCSGIFSSLKVESKGIISICVEGKTGETDMIDRGYFGGKFMGCSPITGILGNCS